MNRLTAMCFSVLFAIFVSFSVYAEETSPPDISSVIKECVTSKTDNFSVIGKEPENKTESKSENKPEDAFAYRLGESLPIKATGKCAEAIKLAANPTQPQPISLYFDDVKIAVLEKPKPQEIAGSEDIQLNFTLVRNSDNGISRKSWDDFFKMKRYSPYTMNVQLAIAIGDDFPIMVKQSQGFKFKFYVATDIPNQLEGTVLRV